MAGFDQDAKKYISSQLTSFIEKVNNVYVSECMFKAQNAINRMQQLSACRYNNKYVACPFYSLCPPSLSPPSLSLPFALRSEETRRLSIDATK